MHHPIDDALSNVPASGAKSAAALSGPRRELLSRLLRAKGIAMPEAQVRRISRQTYDDQRLPLSVNQESLWFIDQLHPGKADFSIPCTVRVKGRLQVKAFEKSFRELVTRHESLRTTFRATEGWPYQTIGAADDWILPVFVLERLPADERYGEARRVATEYAATAFDLERGPLFRAALLRLGNFDHVLMLNLHHIIADGWSIGILTRELSALYEAYAAGRTSPLPALPVRYADFSVWERGWIQGKAATKLMSYWTRQLSGKLPVTELPTDRPRPSVQSYRGEHCSLVVPRSVSEQLRALAQREGVSLFMTLCAAFKALVHCYTRQVDIVIGSTFANRTQPELEGVVGLFANTLPLRTNLSGNPSFRELLTRVCDVTMQAHDHQALPLAKIVQEVQPQRAANHGPIYQLVFDLLTLDHNPAVFGYGLASQVSEILKFPHGLSITPMDVEGGVARFDLAVFLWDMPDCISGSVEYSTDLFDRATVGQLVRNYVFVLNEIANDPAIELGELVSRVQDGVRPQHRDAAPIDTETVRDRLQRAKRKAIRLTD